MTSSLQQNPYFPTDSISTVQKKKPARVSKVDLTARNGNLIRLKTESDDIFGQVMQERKEIEQMQLLEIPFSGMHRLPTWRTSQLLKQKIDERLINESVEQMPEAILENYIDENGAVSSSQT